MMRTIYESSGATLAPDGIPLHFGDLAGEYRDALENAVLLDRSHEGRVEIRGKHRFEIINRTSTNDVLNMRPGEARPTIFTNPNGRILERVVVVNWRDESLLVLTGPGRGAGVANYLQKQVFYGDDAQITNLAETHYQFSLHGPKSGTIINALAETPLDDDLFTGRFVTIGGHEVFVGRLKPFSEDHRILIAPTNGAPDVWQAVITVGTPHGIQPTGGLTYNTLRIRAGVPGAGREINTNYIPLEVGLWDEVSFNKGCYTGQEIIARMESRQQLARTLVRFTLKTAIDAPADLYASGKKAGTLTSSVTAPDGEYFGMGIVKTAYTMPGQVLDVGEKGEFTLTVAELLGTQPAWVGEKQG